MIVGVGPSAARPPHIGEDLHMELTFAIHDGHY